MNSEYPAYSNPAPEIEPEPKASLLAAGVRRLLAWSASRRRTIRAVGMIASASLLASLLALAGSLIQAHFVTPDDLGFLRKYSVIAGYTGFLNLGLFVILQREYPVLMGRGEQAQARRAAAMVQSWVALVIGVVGTGLLGLLISELIQGHVREAAAWFMQIVGITATLYVGYLTTTFRSGHEFERLAKGTFISSIAGLLVLPLFWVWPFVALVMRSVTGSIANTLYLHASRPIRVGWYLPGREFLNLVKRGFRLFVGDYLRHVFWLTVEIGLMYQIAGDRGVGLLVFAQVIATTVAQLLFAVNQVYLPRIAQEFGRSGKIGVCLRMGTWPIVLNLGISAAVIVGVFFVLSPLIAYVFPKYVEAVPLIRILSLQTVIISLSLWMYMLTILEGYVPQFVAALVGLGVFVGVTAVLQAQGLREEAVAWGTLAGQIAFAAIGLLWIAGKSRMENSAGVSVSAR